MAFDLDDEELRVTRRDKGLDKETSNKDVASDSVITHKFAIMQQQIDEKDKRIQELEEENSLLREKVKELDTKNDELLKDLYSANCIIADFSDSIPRQKIKDKIEEFKKEYDEILSEYGNLDTDVIINVPNKNVKKYLDELVIKVLVLQELLEGEK